MADEIPGETKASQEVLKEAGRTAKQVGRGLVDMARLLLAGRGDGGRGREPGADDGRQGVVLEMSGGRTRPERPIVLQRDPFEHLRIAQRQAERDLRRFYQEAKRRADRGDPMDAREFATREGAISVRMGPDRDATAKRMREDVFSKGPMRSDRVPVRAPEARAHTTGSDGRVRTSTVRMDRGAMMAISGLSKGPRAPEPMPSTGLVRGMRGMGR